MPFIRSSLSDGKPLIDYIYNAKQTEHCMVYVVYRVEQVVELIPGQSNAVPVVAVDDEDEALGVMEVVLPQGPVLQETQE
jgi:hypothetical protein